MKTVKRVISTLMILSLSICCLVGCNKETTYKAVSDFFYSNDKGHSYGDGTKEYPIGDTVYMKVKYYVKTNKSDISQVKVVLTIPNINNVDAKYMDGQIITPNYDNVNNVTTYEFTANASEEPMEQECVIQFIPNAVGTITMTLVFDDNVDSSYDKMSTLEFVEPEPDKNSEEKSSEK